MKQFENILVYIDNAQTYTSIILTLYEHKQSWEFGDTFNPTLGSYVSYDPVLKYWAFTSFVIPEYTQISINEFLNLFN